MMMIGCKKANYINRLQNANDEYDDDSWQKANDDDDDGDDDDDEVS